MRNIAGVRLLIGYDREVVPVLARFALYTCTVGIDTRSLYGTQIPRPGSHHPGRGIFNSVILSPVVDIILNIKRTQVPSGAVVGIGTGFGENNFGIGTIFRH